MLKEPDVYIGEIRDVPWGNNDEPDDDAELDTTPEYVVEMLGFDPKEIA